MKIQKHHDSWVVEMIGQPKIQEIKLSMAEITVLEKALKIVERGAELEEQLYGAECYLSCAEAEIGLRNVLEDYK